MIIDSYSLSVWLHFHDLLFNPTLCPHAINYHLLRVCMSPDSLPFVVYNHQTGLVDWPGRLVSKIMLANENSPVELHLET